MEFEVTWGIVDDVALYGMEKLITQKGHPLPKKEDILSEMRSIFYGVRGIENTTIAIEFEGSVLIPYWRVFVHAKDKQGKEWGAGATIMLMSRPIPDHISYGRDGPYLTHTEYSSRELSTNGIIRPLLGCCVAVKRRIIDEGVYS